MGVYIKDMEMPKRCAVCQAAFPNGVDFSCCLIKGYPIIHHETRLQNCPLIPVPDHGRLIDADALKHEFSICGIIDNYGTQINMKIDKSPTVIPADKEEQT